MIVSEPVARVGEALASVPRGSSGSGVQSHARELAEAFATALAGFAPLTDLPLL